MADSLERQSVSTADDPRIDELLALLAALRARIAETFLGQHKVLDEVLTAMLAGGHVLLEGVPGLGKTMLVRTLGQALDLDFHRVQFTPDLMPSDLVGTEVLEEEHGTGHRRFVFREGPVFTNILLADEINRTPPRTQAALLESMEERQVSFGGVTRPLPAPFFVLATENPIEQGGTWPLPEAQLDRFLLKVEIDYPEELAEAAIVRQHLAGKDIGEPRKALATAADVADLIRLAGSVHVADSVLRDAVSIARATRPGTDEAASAATQWLRFGAGPRAALALVDTARARALLNGRFAATREDLIALAPAVLRHRLLPNHRALAAGEPIANIVDAIVQDVIRA